MFERCYKANTCDPEAYSGIRSCMCSKVTYYSDVTVQHTHTYRDRLKLRILYVSVYSASNSTLHMDPDTCYFTYGFDIYFSLYTPKHPLGG